MEKEREIKKVWRKVSHEQSEEEDLFYWAEKSWPERLREVQELRELIWSSLGKKYPLKIEIIGSKKIKDFTDEDDF